MSDTPLSALPERPHLNWLRNRAKEKLAQLRADDPLAQLSQSQLAIAREYGFASWRALKLHIDSIRQNLGEPEPPESGAATIANVPVLAWGKSGETTFCGALSAVLSVTDRPSDYATLMGDSALALRFRWYRADDPAEVRGWCNSSPVGEFSPWTQLAAASVGWSINWNTFLPGFNVPSPVDMTPFADSIVSSIDAGLPVLAYPDQLDMGVIHGYEDFGRTVLARSYYQSKNPDFRVPLAEIKGLLAFLDKKTDQPPRRATVMKALRQMIADFSRPPERRDRDGRTGEYRFGQHGYQTWIADLKSAGSFSPEQQANLWRAGWWTFDLLTDARVAAEKFLTAAADEFAGDAKAALLRAAASARSARQSLGSAFATRDAFLGPWTGKKATDWSDAHRAREVELLSSALTHDANAIAEIRSALKAADMAT